MPTSQPVVYAKMRTPWGKAQSVSVLAPGIGLVHTAGHGGIKCNRATNSTIPELWRRANGWYEEDCECAVPFHFLSASLLAFGPTWLKEALAKHPPLKTLKDTFWQQYEAFFKTTLQPAESRGKDEHVFFLEHASDLIVCSAFGDWANGVAPGMVAVVARPGGYRGNSSVERWFLIPADEYTGQLRFLIDPSHHSEIPPLDPYGPPRPGPTTVQK